VPLIGVVNPSHKEMARDTGGRLPEWLSLGDAMLAAEDGKWSPWPWELLGAMFALYQERDNLISASALVSHCTRADIIKRREDYVEDLESLYVPFRGTLQHQLLETYAHETAIAEARFWTTIADVPVSCSPDHLTKTRLTDYKMTESPPRYNDPWANHSEQVHFNAFIVRNSYQIQVRGGVPTTDFSFLPFDPRVEQARELVLVYLAPKFVKSLTVERTTDYFDFVKGKDVRGKQPYVMDDATALKLLEPRVELFQKALDIYPEWPEGAEKVWGGEPGWECPGYPLCKLPNCIAKRYPNRLVW
jgi:hypothetical protein